MQVHHTPSANFHLTGDITLYAQWQVNNYTSTSTARVALTYQTNCCLWCKSHHPTAPTKTGHTFAGWYKEAGLVNAGTSPPTLCQRATHPLRQVDN
ncbi:hypothetical protein GWK75_01560 [Candidatus Saccharibacteria bacterium oral taxon 955]|nr:hypothetical protein GWK75_01560 [Candidatus Saccharibacteria bacterium oral taxon 955]